MKVELITITPDAEQLIGHIARVSNPDNEDNPEVYKLIRYLIAHKHWSPFEHASMTLEITTSRAIAAQIVRHRSFTFQEFSLRYADVTKLHDYPFETITPRRQDTKNRQNSFDDLAIENIQWFDEEMYAIEKNALRVYKEALEKGIAKESARFALPLNTRTRLYMTGNIRNWIHYIDLRNKEDVQKEHRDVAVLAQAIFARELPQIARALEWTT